MALVGVVSVVVRQYDSSGNEDPQAGTTGGTLQSLRVELITDQVTRITLMDP